MRILLFLAALAAFLWLLLRGLLRQAGAAARAGQRSVRRGEVRRDPVCGTFVDVEVAVEEKSGAEILHFCSEKCRAAYRAQREVPSRKTG